MFPIPSMLHSKKSALTANDAVPDDSIRAGVLVVSNDRREHRADWGEDRSANDRVLSQEPGSLKSIRFSSDQFLFFLEGQ